MHAFLCHVHALKDTDRTTIPTSSNSIWWKLLKLIYYIIGITQIFYWPMYWVTVTQWGYTTQLFRAVLWTCLILQNCLTSHLNLKDLKCFKEGQKYWFVHWFVFDLFFLFVFSAAFWWLAQHLIVYVMSALRLTGKSYQVIFQLINVLYSEQPDLRIKDKG